MNRCYLGLDLGKAQDYSAIALVEALERPRPYGDPILDGLQVRYLERLPLGTTYPRVVEQVRRIVTRKDLAGRIVVVADGTGVGDPVVDMLRVAKLGCEVTAVKITSGHWENQQGTTWMAPKVNVPKQDLIGGLQAVLETGELKIAAGLRYAGTLVKELVDVRVRMKDGGRVRIGADGHGQHDDLVIALALGVWRARKGVKLIDSCGKRLVGLQSGGLGF
jgi:hypothetical protein